MSAHALTAPQRRWLIWLLVPAIFLLALPFLVNAGLGTPRAHAVTSSVQVDATVGSVVTLNVCAGPVSIPVSMGGFQDATCMVTFGASNASGTQLLIEDNDGAAPFLAGGVFADDAGGCAALDGDSFGYKVASTGLTASENHPCAASLAATDVDYTTVPSTSATVCTTTIIGSQDCPIALGISETGADATSGTYAGTLKFSA